MIPFERYIHKRNLHSKKITVQFGFRTEWTNDIFWAKCQFVNFIKKSMIKVCSLPSVEDRASEIFLLNILMYVHIQHIDELEGHNRIVNSDFDASNQQKLSQANNYVRGKTDTAWCNLRTSRNISCIFFQLKCSCRKCYSCAKTFSYSSKIKMWIHEKS